MAINSRNVALLDGQHLPSYNVTNFDHDTVIHHDGLML